MNAKEKEVLKVGVHTFGCRSNYADTVDVQSSLVDQGVVPVSVQEKADVYLLNTCTVTDSADKDVFKLIRKLHSRSPDSRIVVTGCMAEARADELAELDGVDLVVGPGRREDVVSGVLGRVVGERKTIERTDAETEGSRRVKKSLPLWHSISLERDMPESIPGPGEIQGTVRSRSRFHLRVQEGCENSCTFCIIPSTRGRLSSRPLSLIVEDIGRLTELGYEEVVLSGTHLGGWGEDIGADFPSLLRALGEANVSPRIRISSIDPNDLGREALDCLVKYPIFCNHLHICFQAFSDNTLKRMNRKYRLSEAVELVHEVHSALPDCAIGSDIIAGFPGETREEIEEGMELFLRLPISYLHVFPYSERSDTAATRLNGAIPISERKRRAARWRSLAERKREAYLKGLVGRRLDVVVEKIEDKYLMGTSSEFADCRVKLASSSSQSITSEYNFRFGQIIAATAVALDRSTGEVVCEL